MRFLSLFAGIGGFDYALEKIGMECAGQVEIDDFCTAVLEKHWPHVKRMRDIREVKGHEFGTVDLVCGGVPCQPASYAGKRKGTADDRWLWPETFRIVRAIKPAWCLFENVRGLLTLEDGMVFNSLLSELEAIGYEVQPFIIPACALNAPHRRDRVWIVAYLSGARKQPISQQRQRGGIKQKNSDVADTELWRCKSKPRGRRLSPTTNQQKKNQTGCINNWPESWPEVAARLCRVDDGVSRRVDRLKALGNAVAPQVVEQIGLAIWKTTHGPTH